MRVPLRERERAREKVGVFGAVRIVDWSIDEDALLSDTDSQCYGIFMLVKVSPMRLACR